MVYTVPAFFLNSCPDFFSITTVYNHETVTLLIQGHSDKTPQKSCFSVKGLSCLCIILALLLNVYTDTAWVRCQRINGSLKFVFTFQFKHAVLHFLLRPLIIIWIPNGLTIEHNNSSVIFTICVTLVLFNFLTWQCSFYLDSWIFVRPRCLCIGSQSECNIWSFTSVVQFFFSCLGPY